MTTLVIHDRTLRFDFSTGLSERLRLLHGSEKTIPIPVIATRNHACPGIDLDFRGSHGVHAVNGGTTAEQFSSCPRENTIPSIRLRYGGILPVI